MKVPQPLVPVPGIVRRATLFLSLACAPAMLAPRLDAATEPAPVTQPQTGTTLSLEEAIALALQNNQRIKVSHFGPAISRANVLAEYGRFDPALVFRRNHSDNEFPFTTNPPVAQRTSSDAYSLSLDGLAPWGTYYQLGATANYRRDSFNQFPEKYVSFGGITVTQPLLRGFGFGANLAALRVAKADRAISDWQHRQTVIDVVTNVVIAYAALAEAREGLRIATRSRDLAAQLVRDNERRNQVGSISDADVTQARARAANREEFILIAQRAVKDVENQLRLLIGETPFPAHAPDLIVSSLAPSPPLVPDPVADFRRALELRPDYQAARHAIARGRAGDAYARNQLLPRVDFVGSYGYNGVDPEFRSSRAQVRDRDYRGYSAGVVVSVPLTFAEGRGRARAARLALQQSESDLERLQQDIAISVAAAIGQLETTSQRVAATSRAYELAQQALNAEEKRFRAGASSTFFVLQLQEQLAAVQSNHIRALSDQRRAIANYEREIGATLASHNITLE